MSASELAMRNHRRHFFPAVLLVPLALLLLTGGATQEPSSMQEQVLYGFRGYHDGANPYGGVIAGPGGTLYGTTEFCGAGWRNNCPSAGGSAGLGIVFTLKPAGSGYAENILYRFEGGRDGAYPTAGLLLDARGALYGTTSSGGDKLGHGTVFKLMPEGSAYGERVIHRFEGGTDGAYPNAALIAGDDGSLYGTTSSGGSLTCATFFGRGCGTVFKFTRSRARYKESVLYRFQGGSDGVGPFAGLVADSTGALYGTTVYGGGSACNSGCGTVFKLTPTRSGYEESVLYRFQGGSDGAGPESGLLADASGALYGTTRNGGNPSLDGGTVFKLTPAGSGYIESILYRFLGGNDGYGPAAGLIADATGALYGTTTAGGNPSVSAGTVFKLTPTGSGYAETILYRFAWFHGVNDGAEPTGTLIARGRALYGTTVYGGGQPDCGAVFKVTL
jgi:uncharacterized repeat protein (TIGR03803 family)